MQNLFENYQIKKPKPQTKEQLLAEDVWNFLGKRLAFPRIMKLIKTKGYQFIYETYNEVRQSDCKSPVALFLWKCKNQKIKWQN